MIKVVTFGGVVSPKWVRIYYFCGVPVWRRDMNLYYKKFLDSKLRRTYE